MPAQAQAKSVLPRMPEVQVVPRIKWKNQHPVARFVATQNRILLSHEELSRITDDAQWYHVVWHELGHWWHIHYVKKRLTHDQEEQVAEDVANLLAGNGSSWFIQELGGISETLADEMRNFADGTVIGMHGTFGS